ncbi:MAG: biotin/lipoyl-containing protein [Candidatus Thermoplasmatota archaeon]|nr:biotin/lipoyl-containing protein [Candidatus Thermoplasmatota archaeon]MEE2974181.1 biotin/lipoyl-containing protein [Candidatus Thermoplasmatota archaeon]
MQHTFASSEGPVEVTLIRDGEAFVLEGQTLVQHNHGRLHLTLRDGRTCLAHAAKVGDVWWVHLNGRTYKWERIEPGSSGAEDEGGLVAPMPGKVLEVLVAQGDVVEAGTPLMVLEAMKMEHRIVAAADGTVVAVHYEAGDQVAQGAVLLDLE